MKKADPLSHSTLQALRSGRALQPEEINWLEGRFLPHFTEAPNGCWDWTGKRFNVGYGIVYVGNRATPAQRVSYALWHGAIPPDLCICHRCDNRKCVNPEHLFAGTKGDNARDRTDKGRSLRGESHGSTRLSDALVSEMRALSRTIGWTHRRLAAKFGVSKTHVGRILRGDSR